MTHSSREGQSAGPSPAPSPGPTGVRHRHGSRWLARLFPFLAWRERVDARSLRSDLAAGLTGAVVVLPQGVALATVAGMPPEYGLYAGMVPAIVAALWGSSWHLVSGPTTTASIVLFSSLSGLAEPGSADYVRLALTLTLLVGAIELAMGLARLGALANFISHSVVLGFTAGAAILIAAQQAGSFFGVDVPRGLPVHEVVQTLLARAREANPFATAVAVLTLVSGLLARRRWPRAPYLLVAMLAGSLWALLLNAVFGPERTGIGTLGALPGGLPPLSLPDLSLETIRALAPAALATTLLALTGTSTAARSSSARGSPTSPAASSPATSPPAPSIAAPSTSRPARAPPWRPCSRGSLWWSYSGPSPRSAPTFPTRRWPACSSSWPGAFSTSTTSAGSCGPAARKRR